MFPLLIAAALAHFESRLAFLRRGSIREFGQTFNYHAEVVHVDDLTPPADKDALETFFARYGTVLEIEPADAPDAARHILTGIVDAILTATVYHHTYALPGVSGGHDCIIVEFGAYNLYGG